MDFTEGLPLSDSYDTILVIVCHLSKIALFIATHQDIDAEDLAMLFLVHVFSKHGTPSDIVSDRGKHFISCFWRSLCQLLGIKANLSTAYHTETDGQMEWVNQILEQYLQVFINYQQDDWKHLLPLAEFMTPTTTPSTRPRVSLHFLLTRDSTQNSKCPLSLFRRRVLMRWPQT